MYFLFISDAAFQTGWFLESIITELLILYVIRTHRFFLKSRPGTLVIIASLVAFLITVLLPFSPFSKALSLSIANFREVALIALILIAYLLTADMVKIIFFRVYIHPSRRKHT